MLNAIWKSPRDLSCQIGATGGQMEREAKGRNWRKKRGQPNRRLVNDTEGIARMFRKHLNVS